MSISSDFLDFASISGVKACTKRLKIWTELDWTELHWHFSSVQFSFVVLYTPQEPNSTHCRTSTCCGFVVQQAVRQIHKKSK